MKITNIERYKGNTFCLILENGEHLYMNEDILARYGFSKNGDYSSESIAKAIDAGMRRKAKERALYLLSYRDHSYSELLKKLEKTYTEEIAYDICDKMVELGFINDENYACRLARQMWDIKRFGLRKIRFELKQKGFDEEIIDKALIDICEEDPKDKIAELIDKKYARYLTDAKGVNKVTNAIARLGHDFGDIHEVIRNYIEEE